MRSVKFVGFLDADDLSYLAWISPAKTSADGIERPRTAAILNLG